MRRILAAVLALLTICGTALGEGAAFAFDSGIVWGMTPDEVLAIEGDADATRGMLGGADALAVGETMFLGCEAGAQYVFAGGALAMAAYGINLSDMNLSAIEAEMDGRYGAHAAGDAAHCCELMGLLTGLDYAVDADPGAGEFCDEWRAPDGTYIALTNRFTGGGNDVLALFFAEPQILAAAEASLSEPAPPFDPDAE